MEYFQVHRGIKGVVKDSSGASVDGAVIVVQEPNGSLGKNVISSSRRVLETFAAWPVHSYSLS